MKNYGCILLSRKAGEKNMVDEKVVRYPNLLAEIARSGESNSYVADLLGISPPSFSRRLKGEIEWSKSEIDTLCEHYHKTYDYLFSADAV